MTIIRALTVALLLGPGTSAAAQRSVGPDKTAAYTDQVQKADLHIERHQYEEALQNYKKAYALTDKSSFDALMGMAMAYRGLGAQKNVLDLCPEALKLAGADPTHQAQVHNLRGAALVALADKPGDRRLEEAATEFRAALTASDGLLAAQSNLGVTLLKLGRDDEGVQVLQAYVDRAPKGPDSDSALRMIAEPRRAREAFAPAFGVTTRQGEDVALDDLKGKTVLLDFWGTWCKPCVMSTPGLVQLQKKFAHEPVVFLGIAVNDREEAWAAFLDKNKMDWPQYLDSTRRVVNQFGVTGFPTYIVIDAEGIIQGRVTGYGSETDRWIQREIEKALKQSRIPHP